jgi:hypothetical protein
MKCVKCKKEIPAGSGLYNRPDGIFCVPCGEKYPYNPNNAGEFLNLLKERLMKNRKKMSKMKQIVVVEPPAHDFDANQVIRLIPERCPACGGAKGAWLDSRDPRYDPRIGEDCYYSPCRMCGGTGQLMGTVTIKWEPCKAEETDTSKAGKL